MEHRTIGDRPRKVPRHAAAQRLVELDAQDAAGLVETHTIVDAEIVPLAGDDHVVVAVVDAFRRPAGEPGRQRCRGCRQIALAFLAAEAAAHPAHFHRDRMVRHAQHLGDRVLDLARMLARTVDGDVLVLAGDGERRLAFQIEMLLPADLDPAFDGVRRRRNGCRRVALCHRVGRLQETLCRHRVVNGE